MADVPISNSRTGVQGRPPARAMTGEQEASPANQSNYAAVIVLQLALSPPSSDRDSCKVQP